MIIDHNLSNYIIFIEDTILEALKKISQNEGRIIFVVNEKGCLEGVLTNGDFKRWIEKNSDFDITKPVSRIMNLNFNWAYFSDEPSKILEIMGNHTCLPLLDKNDHLIAFARKNKCLSGIRIGKFNINSQEPCFIIAEIGLNHNGDFDLAIKLIDLAIDCGADAVKFQMRDLDCLYRQGSNDQESSEDLGAQYTLDLLKRSELPAEKMFRLFDYCKGKGILPLCTPWDAKSLQHLENYGMEAYKVSSADLTNHDFLKQLAHTKKPLIISTGMSTEDEILESVNILKDLNAQYVLLHCNSTYPTPFKDINLSYIRKLKEIGHCEVGYSGHERGYYIALAALCYGACIIEKHFTIDKQMEGNDHKVSLLPEEFKQMVEAVRQIEQAKATNQNIRLMSQGELINRANLAKSLITKTPIKVGDIILADSIDTKSPGRGIQPNLKKLLIGRRSKRDMQPGDFFFPSDLEENNVTAKTYKFKRKWGVPVRYHDYERIRQKSNLDFLEFHLTFKDLEININKIFNQQFDLDFVVHSPDLFKNDHLLNLSSPEPSYRKKSIEHLQQVINITNEIKPYFKHSKNRTLLIASLGGFSKDGFISATELKDGYSLAIDSLSKLNTDGVEIIPQTLPPFPWYFGGQLFANLWTDSESIKNFCLETGYRICFDICHSQLTCTHNKSSILDYIEDIGPFTAHLHIADADGVDGEGLQIGEGIMDFRKISQLLDKHCPDASFIPEIWQGHKNDGDGFWNALERMEGLF